MVVFIRPNNFIFASLPFPCSTRKKRGLPSSTRLHQKIMKTQNLALLITTLSPFTRAQHEPIQQPLFDSNSTSCPVGVPLRPSDFTRDNSSLNYILYNADYAKLALERWSSAVKIPTESFHDMGHPYEDQDNDVWVPFSELHQSLEDSFPLVHSQLKLEKINGYGLLYTWQGSNRSLKPMMFAAHQDVVPVDDSVIDQWKYPPYSAYFDGEFLWGRGSSDCKTTLVSTLAAVEKLLEDGFETERTVLMSFGYDEEVSGDRGAKYIGETLLERYGPDSIYSLIDEGPGVIDYNGRKIALPGIGEKGFTTITVELSTKGGHSSMPPPNTNIGIMSKLISLIEDTPFEPVLDLKNPAFGLLQCLAEHTTILDQNGLKKLVMASKNDELLRGQLALHLSSDPLYGTFVRTTQAVDIFHGGVAANALPEYSNFSVNHRIGVDLKFDDVLRKILDNVVDIAEAFDIGVTLGNGTEVIPNPGKKGQFIVNWDRVLEPAPITPIGDDHWRILVGSIKHITEDLMYADLTDPVVVSGFLMLATTDTNRYWDLTSHIYRFQMTTNSLSNNIHGVDEHAPFSDHLHQIAFIYEYIKNVNEHSTSE